MKQLNQLNLNISDQSYILQNRSGVLQNRYAPFKNLIDEFGDITYFTVKGKTLNKIGRKANTNNNEMLIQPSFDGSVNVIFSNDAQSPMLINSRFSVEEESQYSIVDHLGTKDSNLYDINNLQGETKLYKITNNIITLDYQGLSYGGNLLCGTYYFYFKLSDNDGNESDFISESGMVCTHIGNIKEPDSIRMGLENENSQKCVNFQLNNLDNAFESVVIYYSRTTSDESGQKVTSYHKIDYDYKLNNSQTLKISITGNETVLDITKEELFSDYEYPVQVKSFTSCQNFLFLANVYKQDIPYEELRKISLQFIPSVRRYDDRPSIGNLDENYKPGSDNLVEYYDTEHLYYNLGYFPEEYYRLGIVYIMKDGQHSPVFNIRGGELEENDNPTMTVESRYNLIDDELVSDENGLLLNRFQPFENTKGVVKLPKSVVINNSGVRPLSIKLTYYQQLEGSDNIDYLKSIINGFYFVRQERIPTILAQGINLYKTKHQYGDFPILPNPDDLTEGVTQGFLKQFKRASDGSVYNKLETSKITTSNVENKILLSPEASIREEAFNQIFTSSDFILTDNPTQQTKYEYLDNHYFIKNYEPANNITLYNSTLTLVDTDVQAISNTNGDIFSSKIGQPETPHEAVNVKYTLNDLTADKDDGRLSTALTKSDKYVKGNFCSHVGCSSDGLKLLNIYNIRPNDYADSDQYTTLQIISRGIDNSEYRPITDRFDKDSLFLGFTLDCYRGDCFIGNSTHRILTNFIDPELPTSNDVVDPMTWDDNFAVYNSVSGSYDEGGQFVIRKVLPLYKLKESKHNDDKTENGVDYDSSGTTGAETRTFEIGSILTPDDPMYDGMGKSGKGSKWKEKGYNMMNRIDVNSVQLGHWFTFKVMSNINISFRDIDRSKPTEQALFNKPRSFYPLNAQDISATNKLPESTVINGATNKTLSDKGRFLLPDVPFIKNNFDNRIYFSDVHVNDAFKNGYRIFRNQNYKDYTKEHGAITKLLEWYGSLVCVMEHGVLLIPVKERTVFNEDANPVYINARTILPENPQVISDKFGSTWMDSVIKTQSGIYGIDTVAKKIWHFDGKQFLLLSDLKLQKFLNENINLKEYDKYKILGFRDVKTHYNAFKGDVMFTYYNFGKEWNLCYNENLKKFITFYSWLPYDSENINNVFLSFDKNVVSNNFATLSSFKFIGSNKGDSLMNSKFFVSQDYGLVDENGEYNQDRSLTFNMDLGLLDSSKQYQLQLEYDITDYSKYLKGIIYCVDGSERLNVVEIDDFSKIIINPIYNKRYYFELVATPDTKVDYTVRIGVITLKYYSESLVNDTAILWKHGQAGIIDGEQKIKPTTWYGITEPFEFEFVISEIPMYQKIFNNLKFISNKCKPTEFEFEIVGETYDWFNYKKILNWVNDNYLIIYDVLQSNYLIQFKSDYSISTKIKNIFYFLLTTTQHNIKLLFPDFPAVNDLLLPKLPYLPKIRKYNPEVTNDFELDLNSSNVKLIEDELLNETRIRTVQLANNITDVGRLRGNMQYLEDSWNIEIRPINFQYVYVKDGDLLVAPDKESRIRDKYLKVRVKYSGEDLAIVQAIRNFFTISYA